MPQPLTADEAIRLYKVALSHGHLKAAYHFKAAFFAAGGDEEEIDAAYYEIFPEDAE